VAPEPTITEVTVPRVVWRDPMGLVERETTSSATPVVVSRYPPELLRIGAVRLERTTPLPGETHSRKVGESGEFHGIRPARPDDPPRQINWRATARAGRSLANEYDLDKTGDILLILDARPTPLGPAVDQRLFSIARAAAVGLSDSFLRVKSRVGLGLFGEFLEVVPLSTGRIQRIRIELALRRAHLSEVAAPPVGREGSSASQTRNASPASPANSSLPSPTGAVTASSASTARTGTGATAAGVEEEVARSTTPPTTAATARSSPAPSGNPER